MSRKVRWADVVSGLWGVGLMLLLHWMAFIHSPPSPQTGSVQAPFPPP